LRYLGNKDSILYEIEEIVKIKKLKKGKVFFDAFSGTASVGNHFKNKFKIIAIDNLYLSFVYSYGKLNNPSTKFEKLGLNPFDYFNEPNVFLDGFVYKNYSPGGSNRMYFSEENVTGVVPKKTSRDQGNFYYHYFKNMEAKSVIFVETK